MPELTTTTDCFFIAHNGTDYAPGQLKAGQHVASGYPTLTLYPTLEELNAALAAAGQPAYVPEG